jgi:predicted restriction endonuclease
MLRPCLDCGALIESGSRCTRCDGRRDRRTPGRSGRAQAAFRAAVLQRDGTRCRALLPDGTRCPVTDPAQLEAHHLTKLRERRDYSVRNGICLCLSHHRLAEEIRR